MTRKEKLFVELEKQCLEAYRSNRDSRVGEQDGVYFDPETECVYSHGFVGGKGVPMAVFEGKDMTVAYFSDYDESSGAGFLDAVFENLETRILEELDVDDEELMKKVGEYKEDYGIEAYEKLFPEIYEEKLNELKEEDEAQELESVIRPAIREVLKIFQEE